MPALPQIPGYELLHYLGGGQVTAVFSARDCAADKSWAIKVLRPNWDDHATGLKLLQREARAGLSVRHPQLVRIEQAHVTRAPYFLVMELLAGESLRKRLERDYRLEAPEAVWIARQIAEALAALHRAGFIHGDVKPDNVRLVGNGTAVLIDLGFAHRPGENGPWLRQGYILGTVDYLAPELCQADARDDPSSDLFSFGVMLFEMLTGETPYPPGSIEGKMQRRCAEPPADIRPFAPALPSALVTLVDRLLAREPADRPRAAAVVQQLIALEIATLRRTKAA